MALKLVTGPANSAKAGEVLGGFRDRLREEPLLVVPAFQDLEHAQREMADRGAIFGTEIVLFERLFRQIARRTGYSARRASRIQRELIVEQAVRGAGLRILARSAAQPGFVRAATRFVTEIGRTGVEPQAFSRALDAWRANARYPAEIAAIFAGYRERLEAAGLVDAELFAWRALDALRREPHRWGRSPVFFYGFDDFTPLELDAIETLSSFAGADVVVSLPYERGRVAFKAIAGVFERLSELADEHVELPPSDEHYAAESRPVLAHLERELFTAEPAARVPAGEAIRRLQAGGRRAEVEQVAAQVLALLRTRTVAPGDVAVVFRSPPEYGSLVEQVFGAYGIPYSIDRRVPLGHTSLGRGLLALARASSPGGTAEDLLAYLRTPGLLDRPHLADRLEAQVRQDGARTAAAARERWTQWDLRELDALAGAKARGTYLDELERRLEALFSRPYTRAARILGGDEVDDARVYRQALEAIAEMRRLGGGEMAAPDPLEVLERLQVRLGDVEQPDRVQVTAPESIRARRFQAVFACGLQEGEFPRRVRGEAFLSDDERREINAASGLQLPVREDQLDRERYLFYVTASRAERLLVLSARTSDEEGNPELPSFFLEDVKDVVDGLAEPDAERTLSDVTWAPEEAPTPVEWQRAVARVGPRVEPAVPDGLRDPATIEELAGEWTFSASALETFADCPVKWLVEKRLKPSALEPDAEQMVRGSYAHDVLSLTFTRLRERTGSARVTRETLPTAEWLLMDALVERESSFKISPKQTRVRTAVRRLEFDLLRLLRAEACSDIAFEPTEFEKPFEVTLEGVRIVGRIDRVDRRNGWALVRDYKSGSKGYPVAKWKDDHRLQVALYMLALREIEDVELAGGVYQPLAGKEPRPRGALLVDAREDLGEATRWFDNDFVDADGLEKVLADAREAVGEIVGRLRRGEVKPCPSSCLWSGGHGCTYPSVCRVDA